MVIRRIGVLSVAKVAGLLYGVMGLLFGACIALFSLAGSAVAADEEVPAFVGALFGVGAIVFLPILYGILGFLFVGLLAALYNVVAGMTGGVVVDVE
jgi:hypothetical protein